jgi:hypothetical protein
MSPYTMIFPANNYADRSFGSFGAQDAIMATAQGVAYRVFLFINLGSV